MGMGWGGGQTYHSLGKFFNLPMSPFFPLILVTEKVYESESCTDSEEELKATKTSCVQRPSAMTVKKEPKEERKGPKKGTAALGKANRQVSITGFFQRK